MTAEVAILALREELNEIAAIEACAGCECLLGVAAQALADLRRLSGEEAREAEDDLRLIVEAGRGAEHACTACDPCLPVEPYRRFREALAASGRAVRGATGEVEDASAPPLRGCRGCGCGGCG